MRGVQLPFESLLRRRVVSREHARAYDPTDDSLPERASRSGSQSSRNGPAPLAHEACQGPELGGEESLELFAQAPGKHRGVSGRAHSDHDRRAVDDGREDERGELGVVHDVDRNPPLARCQRHGSVDRTLAGRSDDELGVVEMFRVELGADVCQLAGVSALTQLARELRGNHR